jgi:hypothetical protein
LAMTVFGRVASRFGDGELGRRADARWRRLPARVEHDQVTAGSISGWGDSNWDRRLQAVCRRHRRFSGSSGPGKSRMLGPQHRLAGRAKSFCRSSTNGAWKSFDPRLSPSTPLPPYSIARRIPVRHSPLASQARRPSILESGRNLVSHDNLPLRDLRQNGRLGGARCPGNGSHTARLFEIDSRRYRSRPYSK